MPIFFIHASLAKKVASTNTAASSLAAQRSEDGALCGRRLRETPS